MYPFNIRLVFRAALFSTLLGVTATTHAADCNLVHPAELVKVDYIHDGDTFITSDRDKIRVIGLDTPELAIDGNNPEPFAEEARDVFRQLSKSSADKLYIYRDKTQKDRYKRSLAHVFLQNGKSVAQYLLESGLATALIIPPNISFADCYLTAQDSARTSGRGIWRLPQYQVSRLAEIDLTVPSQYRLVSGFVRAIHSERGKQKIVIQDEKNELVAIIHNSEKHLFESLLSRGLIGNKVIVQGWINHNQDGLFITLRHPGFIRILS